MQSFRRLRQQLAWLASLAVLVGALAPALSQWLTASQPAAFWAEVCSSSQTPLPAGLQLAKAEHNGSSSPDRDPVSVHTKVCAYCVTHAGSFGLAPVETLAVPDDSHLQDTLVAHASTPGAGLQAHHYARARAPPVLA
ncbi:DUF2946 family protein [Aquabacterium sp.]|uniref:DUF2946 family protein n=1 Tax=Aquabacterium sp. TaxID=1872578 RepID=UPI0035AE4974